MYIKNRKKFNQGDYLRVSYDIVFEDKSTTLWFDFEPELNDALSYYDDSALISLLIPAMLMDDDLIINGRITKELYQSLDELQKILIQLIPHLSYINIECDYIEPSIYRDKSLIVTGYSAGVDSYNVLKNNFFEADEKINILFYNNVGSHGDGEFSLFTKRFSRLKNNTDKLNLPFISINSNLQDFYPDENLNFMQTHTLRNMAVVFLFAKKIKKYYYASGYKKNNMFIGQSTDMATMDIFILKLLSNDNFELVSSGSDMSRTDKTKNISDLAFTYNTLDVCTNSHYAGKKINCSKCSKCMRTQLTLDILGRLDKYNDVFDIELFYKNKAKYIGEIYALKNVFSFEIIDLAKEHNYELKSGYHFVTQRIFQKIIKPIAIKLMLKVKKYEK